MLKIAAAGALAESVGMFDSGPLRQYAEWLVLPPQGTKGPQIDLIIRLQDDQAAARAVAQISESNSIAGAITCTWPSIPAPAQLDQVVQQSLAEVYGFIVGYSESMHAVCRWVRAVAHEVSAAIDLRTLVIGETGTGKELVAQSIHRLGGRRDEPFVALNCGALPAELIDSELFGHKRGAFTSAIVDRTGALQAAGTGILFLDEIGEMPTSLQVKFLRVLEQRSFSPLGSNKELPMLAQIIAATNRPLDEGVREGWFRADLYFRLAQLIIHLPPLRERKSDIPLLVSSFLRRHGLDEEIIDERAQQAITAYDWPGNIRELRSVVERLVLLWRSGNWTGATDWLPSAPLTERQQATRGTLSELRNSFDRQVLVEVLAKCQGDTKRAAAELGITQRSVYNLAHRLGIELGKVPH